jgi:glycosyltransferase involved in cell wall biosynthesis
MEKVKLSIIIVARNEQEMIEDCLKSAVWADELVLLDTGSSDKTIEIAKRYGARIIYAESRERDFAAWHNQGKKEAKDDWLFKLDADERITPELQKEIISIIQHPIHKIFAYALPRQNVLLGRLMHFGGWYPDYQIRLFKKEKLIRWEGKLHERPIFKGELGYLKNPMIHLTHRDLSTMVEKTKEWSKIEAQLLFDANHPPVTWWRILRVMLSEFNLRFLKLQAWRDGTVGWIEGLFQVFNRFLIYAKLWEIQNQRQV